MFRSWSIKQSISFGFAVLLACMGCLAGISAERTLHVLAVQSELAEGAVPAAELASDFQREMLNARINLIYFVTIQKPGAREQGLERLQKAEAVLAKMTALVGERPELSDLQPLVSRLNSEFRDYKTELVATVRLVSGGTTSGDAYTAQVKAWAARGALLVGDADKTQVLSAEISTRKNVANIASLRATANASIALFLGSLAGCIVLAVATVVRINRRLRQITGSLDESAARIARSSGEIAGASQALAQNACEQAAAIEETASASTQINAMAARTRDRAKTTAAIAASSQAGCEAANTSLAEMETAMQAIHGSSQRVSQIVKVIDGIAFQTNILALNAAVEAARAGAQGDGFAVVADEVRNLAQRCANAARDTAELVDESMERSTKGSQQLRKVAEDMRTVTRESQRIRELVEEMQVGGGEQSQRVAQIDQAITQMKQVTQSGAAQAEEGAASATELSSLALSMNDLVVGLKALVEG